MHQDLGRGSLLFSQTVAQLLDAKRAARIGLGLAESPDQLEQRHRSRLGMADHPEERRRVGRPEDAAGHVNRFGGVKERQIAVVGPARESRPFVHCGVGHGAQPEDLFRLKIEDVPGHVDQPAGDRKVDRSVLPDALEVRFGELHQVDLPRVELLLHHELEEERDRLLERVGNDDVDAFLQVLDEGEVALEQRGGRLALPDQGTVEYKVAEYLLCRLSRDRRRGEELGRLGLGNRQRASRGVTASGARAFSRPSTSWMSSRSIPTTWEQPSPRIVTPKRWWPNLRVTLRSEMTMNWARSALRRSIRPTNSALSPSSDMSTSSKT